MSSIDAALSCNLTLEVDVNLGLGRRYAPDDNDVKFLLSPQVPSLEASIASRGEPWSYWWMGGVWLNQGSYPHCVGYSWTHWLEDGPITQPNLEGTSTYADSLYAEAQLVDERETPFTLAAASTRRIT